MTFLPHKDLKKKKENPVRGSGLFLTPSAPLKLRPLRALASLRVQWRPWEMTLGSGLSCHLPFVALGCVKCCVATPLRRSSSLKQAGFSTLESPELSRNGKKWKVASLSCPLNEQSFLFCFPRKRGAGVAGGTAFGREVKGLPSCSGVWSSSKNTFH